ncbi:unnamed protein product, partial [Scytosiphon promiscuus]
RREPHPLCPCVRLPGCPRKKVRPGGDPRGFRERACASAAPLTSQASLSGGLQRLLAGSLEQKSDKRGRRERCRRDKLGGFVAQRSASLQVQCPVSFRLKSRPPGFRG